MAGRARWRKAARSASTRVGVVWFLFQSTIILAVVQSNISWRWADGGVQVGVIGVGLAYLATLIVSGWGRPQIRGEKIVLKMTTKVVVSTAAVIAAAGLCWQMAVAQAEIDRLTPRPPLPIPNVVALMPPTVPLLRSSPTPIPPDIRPTPAPIPVMMPIPQPRPAWMTPAMMPPAIPAIIPSHIPLPPAEYDHPYAGKLVVLKEDTYNFIRHVCRHTTPNAIACSYRTFDSVTGQNISCLIMLGPDVHENEQVLQHEIGHCNGWSNDHERAR